jgi:hypothetical protein
VPRGVQFRGPLKGLLGHFEVRQQQVALAELPQQLRVIGHRPRLLLKNADRLGHQRILGHAELVDRLSNLDD